MGQYTEGSIVIELKSKSIVAKVVAQIKNMNEYIKAKSDEPFSFDIDSVKSKDKSVYVELSSDRRPNAEWRMEQISLMCKELFVKDIESFSGDFTNLDCGIYWDEDSE